MVEITVPLIYIKHSCKLIIVMRIFGKVKSKTSNSMTLFFQDLDVVEEDGGNETKHWGKPFLAL